MSLSWENSSLTCMVCFLCVLSQRRLHNDLLLLDLIAWLALELELELEPRLFQLQIEI